MTILTSQGLYKKIHRIQIATMRLAQDILAGTYRSAFKGRGMEFEEVREYQEGDEIRSIDWNVTARMNHPYIKNFREERDLTVFLLVDLSASMLFGSKSELKSTLIAEIGAVLAFSAIHNQDRIGLILFSDQVEHYIPARKGTRHVLRLIRDLLLFEPKHRGSDMKAALSFLGKIQIRSCICFLLSDFFCNDYAKEAALTANRHDLIGIAVTDPHEHHLPNIGLAHIKDLETGQEDDIDTSSDEVWSHMHAVVEERLQFHEHLLKSLGADFIDIRTDESYVEEIKKFFILRARGYR